MPKVDTPRLAISFSFPDALPHAENDTPRFFHQHGVKGVLRVDVPASQHCDLVKITLQGILLLSRSLHDGNLMLVGRTVNKIVYGPPEYGSASITLAAFQSRESTVRSPPLSCFPLITRTTVPRIDRCPSLGSRRELQKALVLSNTIQLQTSSIPGPQSGPFPNRPVWPASFIASDKLAPLFDQ